MCIKFSAIFNFEIFIKAADYNYTCKLPEINIFKFILSLTVDTWLIISLYGYGGTNEDVHFYWPYTEMIGILRQLKSTSTETEISQTDTQWIYLFDGRE